MKRDLLTSFTFKNWYKVSALVLLCYLPFLFNFLWGNHDWGWVKEYTPLDSGVFEGRYSQFLLPITLFSGNILPIFSLTFGLIFYAGAAVLLCRLWQVPEKTQPFILISLCLITAPYTLSWLYFAFLTLSCLSWPLVIIISFLILQNTNIKKAYAISTATILQTLALGGYPPVINMIGVIFFSLVINDLCLKQQSLKTLIKNYSAHVISTIGAIILLMLIQYLLKAYNLQHETYNTIGINLMELPQKLAFCFMTSVRQFFMTTTFIGYLYKYIMCCLFLLAVIRLYLNLPKKPLYIIVFFLLMLGMLISSVTTLVAAENKDYVLFEPRIEFFGLLYIYIFSIAVLWRSSKTLIKNITFAATAILILYNFNSIAYAAKIWSLGFRAENGLSERIITRLEEKPEFMPQTRQYTFVQGGVLDFRSRYYVPSEIARIDSYTLTAPYIPWHLPYKAYTFYYPYAFVKSDFDTFWSYVAKDEIPQTPALKNYLTNTIDVWPNKTATYVSPELIILTLSKEGKGLAQRWYEANF